jgi:hypothetical protein
LLSGSHHSPFGKIEEIIESGQQWLRTLSHSPPPRLPGRQGPPRRLAVPLPAGLVRRPSGEVVLDPDKQMRSVVGLVFDLFERLGTVGAVLGFLEDSRIRLGVWLRAGPERGELAWRRPSRAGLANMLRNPASAGIYAHGRSTLDP